MPNVNALVKLVKEPEGTAVEVGDDLNDHTAHGGGVDRFQSIWASAKVENTKLTQQQNQALFSVVGHFLESVVDVGSLLQHSESRVINVPTLFLVGVIGFRDPL